jgi:hypothetical protein
MKSSLDKMVDGFQDEPAVRSISKIVPIAKTTRQKNASGDRQLKSLAARGTSPASGCAAR